jgi:DNA repair ATPase RecN
MINKIKINQLRVKGVTKDYVTNFKGGLNIISGEISTGKTTILDLIDYCFGEEEPPRYPEIYRKANIAFLEIEIGEDKFTIERQMYSKRNIEQIHFCSMNEISSEHRTVEVKTV